MKTIKLSLIGILSLFITVLLLKYAVISYQYITIDFTTIGSTEVYNFGITFLIQCILLLSLSIIAFGFTIVSFTQANKYYKLWCTKRKVMQLVNHIDEEEYNEVVKNVEKASNTLVKKEHVHNYLNKHRKALVTNAGIQAKSAEEQLRKTDDIVKENNNRIAKRVSLDDAIKMAKAAPNIIPERDTYQAPEDIQFIPKESK